MAFLIFSRPKRYPKLVVSHDHLAYMADSAARLAEAKKAAEVMATWPPVELVFEEIMAGRPDPMTDLPWRCRTKVPKPKPKPVKKTTNYGYTHARVMTAMMYGPVWTSSTVSWGPAFSDELALDPHAPVGLKLNAGMQGTGKRAPRYPK